MKSQVADALSQGKPLIFQPAAAGRFFCGGFDLDDLLALPPTEVRDVFADLLTLTRLVFEAPVPVLVLADGHAVGVGGMLALASDRTVLSRRAKIRFPETAIGLGTLSDIVDLLRFRTSGRTAELMAVHARPVTAEQAVALALADSIVDGPGDPLAEMKDLLLGLDLDAFVSAKAACRRGVLAVPVEAQLDAFMAQWMVFRESRTGGTAP
ncbi:hypothetical protein C882_1315 [Caenispirillum salinarum AK4]|uniref:Enoyl-CoA hydratase/isomerase domain-containing protein n=2 Tax=Caenispirillum TaxID=414051 RepID=K9GP56_9PROT|nr:hypothetical protein C882_1315 [Caenispirillum salinarum AK4]